MIKYVKTKVVPLDELTPYPGNARRGRVDVITESLEKNGQYRSLVVREIENGPLVVLAGNHTLLALGEIGTKGARCEIVRCDDATARRINLVDNRASDLATDDDEALVELLAGLDGDGAGTGFTEDDIAKMLEPSGAVVPPAPPEEFAEYDEQIKTEHSCPKCGYAWSGGGA